MNAPDYFRYHAKDVPFEIVDCEGFDFEKPQVEVHPANGCEVVECIIESARRGPLAADQGDEAPGAGA